MTADHKGAGDTSQTRKMCGNKRQRKEVHIILRIPKGDVLQVPNSIYTQTGLQRD